MKRRPRIALLIALCVLVAGAAMAAVLWLRTAATLEFKVSDSVSGRWVWNAYMQIQDRARAGFFQSDAGLVVYRLNRLAPGATTLRISAPGYQAVAVPLRLHRGVNTIAAPIAMVGLGITDLAKFFVFEKIDAGDIVGELRPVSTAGAAIVNHPCMDLWVGCRVSVQLTAGSPSAEESDAGAARGKELFRGKVTWAWDPTPETQFRYHVRIPAAGMTQDASLYRVIDYLIVEPDPLKITREELGALMERVYALKDPARMTAALDAESGRLRYFVDTSWNVKARQE